MPVKRLFTDESFFGSSLACDGYLLTIWLWLLKRPNYFFFWVLYLVKNLDNFLIFEHTDKNLYQKNIMILRFVLHLFRTLRINMNSAVYFVAGLLAFL